MGKINLGDNVSIASQSLVNKSFGENDILLAGMPAIVKKEKTGVVCCRGRQLPKKSGKDRTFKNQIWNQITK